MGSKKNVAWFQSGFSAVSVHVRPVSVLTSPTAQARLSPMGSGGAGLHVVVLAKGVLMELLRVPLLQLLGACLTPGFSGGFSDGFRPCFKALVSVRFQCVFA